MSNANTLFFALALGLSAAAFACRRRPNRLLNRVQGTRRYTDASTRLTENFRVEKVRTCSVQMPTRPAWPLWASNRNARSSTASRRNFGAIAIGRRLPARLGQPIRGNDG
jgi:hypothetical protein